MKMKFWNVRGIAAILFLICGTSAFAQSMADAQKAYVAGNWKQAATSFEQACPKEPDSLKTECLLWNVLALSQTGNAKDFSKAGKRLDSLIQKTSPQHKVYADLLMTKAQFQLYLGRYEKAAEDLVSAIETSQPHQAVVLQKVCSAVQAKVKKEALDEACKKLSSPDALAEKKAQPPAAVQPESTPAKVQSSAKTEPSSSSIASQGNGGWYLQLGAFGVKSNAEFLVSNLKKRGIESSIEERVGETKTLYVVQTGNFETKEKAIDFGAEKLSPLNIEFRAYLRK